MILVGVCVASSWQSTLRWWQDFFVPSCPDSLCVCLATILVNKVPENLLKELKILKMNLACKTWADLFSKLVKKKGKVFLAKSKAA
jgi:hypothetical protein